MGNGPCSTSPDVYTLHHQSHKSTKERTRVIAIKVIGQKFFVPFAILRVGCLLCTSFIFLPSSAGRPCCIPAEEEKVFFFWFIQSKWFVGHWDLIARGLVDKDGEFEKCPTRLLLVLLRTCRWMIYICIHKRRRAYIFISIFVPV